MTYSDGEHGQCGHLIQGKSPTNLKCYLKTKHHKQFKEKKSKQQQPQGEATEEVQSATADEEEPLPKRFKHLKELLSKK